MELCLEFPGIPKAKQSFRYGVGKGGFVVKYQDKKVKEKENTYAAMAYAQLPKGFLPTDKPIKAIIKHCFPVITSIKKGQKDLIAQGLLELPKSTKPDVTDNLNKGIFDCLQGIVYLNDSQIYDMHATKVYSNWTGVKLQLFFMD